MKGYVMLRIGKVRWTEKKDLKCGSMDAICRPVALTLCSSDIHTVYEGGMGERHNMMLGHKAVGEVVKMGSMVKGFEVGDQVIIPAITPDWSSVAAQESYAMHPDVPLGDWKLSSIKDDVFAKLIHVNDADGNLAHLSERISPEAGAMLSDMITTGLHGAELASIEPGSVVAVIGIGPVGLMSVANASTLGAGHLFAVGSRPKCIEVAQEFGIANIISYREGGIVEQIMEATEGQGVNQVVVTGGSLDAPQQAFDIPKVGGQVANVSYPGEGKNIKISRKLTMVGMGHKHFVGDLIPGDRNRMDRMTNLVLAGHIHPGKVVTHHFTRIEHMEDGVELTRTKPRDLIRPIILV